MAWPSDLVRTKDWGTEVLTDSDLEGQLDNIIDYIDDMMDETTGHKHDGTTNEGPLIQLNGGNIGVTGELQETDGGTGLSAYTQGDILQASGTNTLAVLNLGSAGQAVVVNSGGTQVEYGKPNNFTLASEATGDVAYFNGTNWVRLAIGTAGQTLAVNSGATAPEWVNRGGLTFVESGTDSGASTIDVSETIATDEIVYIVMEGSVSGAGIPRLRVNGSSSAEYSWLTNGSHINSSDTISSRDDGNAGSNDTEIELFSSNTVPNGAMYFIELWVVDRSNQTNIRFKTSYNDEDTVAVFDGMGVWTNTAQATAFAISNSASQTYTGRFYVYRYNKS